MLLRLDIENFAIIKKSALVFGPGLTVFTGQTGAGKSILLDALGLCLGARADIDLIRHGEDKAIISAVFDIQKRTPIYNMLSEYGFPTDTNELVIRRLLVRDGNSRCFLNDYPASLTMVKQIANYLMEIHQQFDRMLDSSAHRNVLDEYAQNESLLTKTKIAFQDWKKALQTLEDQKASVAEALREKEFLEHKVTELKNFSPKENEEDVLTEQRTNLKQKDAILKAYKLVADTFDGDIKSAALQSQKVLSKFDDTTSTTLCENIERVLSDMIEIADQAQEQLHTLLDSPLSLTEIEDRLYELRHLARKYNCLPNELPESLNSAEKLLETITTSSHLLKKMEEQVVITKENFIQYSAELSALRKAKASELDTQIAAELPPLKLGQAKFLTSISTLPESEWNTSGMDNVEFIVDMNKQGIMLPLNKVASGGEIARLMLALKVCLARSGSIPGLVFDEVDSGVGGDVANAVGQRLRRLSQHLQVLVITHPPQVASAGDTHWVIEKTINHDGVETKPTILNYEQRTNEIARMLSGDKITPEAKAAATVLLQSHAL